MDKAALIISIVGSIISGMVLFLLKRFFNKRDKREEELRNNSKKENILILKSIDAIGKLTYANAIAIRDGKTNGELKDGLESYKEVSSEMYDYLLNQNANKA